MLTAAVRDLHLCCPGQFITDVRTPCPDFSGTTIRISRHSDEGDSDVEGVIECHYPLIHQSNQRPVHFLSGFIEYLNEKLDVNARPTAFKGDIHISEAELELFNQVENAAGGGFRYWLINAGGKMDFTCKMVADRSISESGRPFSWKDRVRANWRSRP